jgi:hypothetical protein
VGPATRRSGVAPGVWALVGALLWFFHAKIEEILWVLSFVPQLIWLIAGLVLFGSSFEREYRWRLTVARITVSRSG